MADDPAYREALRALAQLSASQRWSELEGEARRAAIAYPGSSTVHAFAAHALRQLGRLEEGYAWAVRASALDPDDLFAVNRVSLLANLTGRHEEAFAASQPLLDRAVVTAADAQNLAVTIVNSIHAAAKLDRIPEAVALCSVPALGGRQRDLAGGIGGAAAGAAACRDRPAEAGGIRLGRRVIAE